ncbi:membrane protein [Microbacterium phage Zhengyi]|nr:membrane protein [Microbacterium phage Zhengyi]
MSEALPLCGHGETITLYPTPDNCFEQFTGKVIVHYKGEDYTYQTPELAEPLYATGQNCPDLYATCNSTAVVWKFEEPVKTELPPTGGELSLVLLGAAIMATLFGAGLIIRANKKK